MKILINNGHGIQTKGKRSPDGTLLEYAYTRELARQIVKILQYRGYDSELLVPEDDDIPLSERVRRINEICLTYEPSCPAPTGHHDVILISLHINAAGDGTKWMNATGWSCYTCKGQTESDRLADCLYKAAEQILKNQVIRTDYARDGDPDWEENFYILRKTPCAAVLSENYFMDNKSDLKYLQNQTGKQAIIDTHVEGIEEWIESKKR
ncbi:MAG: N-acetylmuramoyl-L-alanine amidase [Bacteroidales bacterium]|nr:N-acetylmuramoyl-L-alanine amidase [Bacteroidales bacterium]